MMKSKYQPSVMAERYFSSLITPVLHPDGKFHQPAPTRFVDLLRSVHATYRPKFDLSQCLAKDDGSRRVWFWSDQHFGHTTMVGVGKRPFGSVSEMNLVMAQNYQARVQKGDIVIFGGDIQLKDLTAANRILRELPGYKILILGNHDVEDSAVLRLAVDEVAPCLEMEYHERSLFLTHYPLAESALEPLQLNIHGHIHANPLPVEIGNGARHINMSVEHTGYAPVLLKDLLAGR